LAAATGERQINHARLINNKQVGARPDGRCNTRRNYELQIITENEADSTLFKQVITDSNLPSTFTATFVGLWILTFYSSFLVRRIRMLTYYLIVSHHKSQF